jgi:hypothetical protein
VIAIVLFSAAPKKAAVGAAIAVAVQALAFTAIFGFGLWDDSVIAQMYTGRRGLDVLKGVWGQAFWSLVGLVALAFGVWRKREALRDAPLVKVLAALAVAMLATLITNSKDGTGLNVIVPIEAALVPLALAAVAVSSLRVVATVALTFTLAQSVSLVASPNTASPFIYPTSERGAWGRAAGQAQVKADVARAEACPAGVAFSGPPFLAFLADRAMPDEQPDQFLPSRSTHLADVQKRMDAVQPRCG